MCPACAWPPLWGEADTAPCWTQLVPAGSTLDALKGIAEPISQGGSTSGNIHLRKGRKRHMGTGVGDKRRWETAVGAPWQEEELHGRADIPSSLWRTCAVDFPVRICSLWKAYTGAEEKCEKEEVAERNHRPSSPHCPPALLGREGLESGRKLSLGEVAGKVF